MDFPLLPTVCVVLGSLIGCATFDSDGSGGTGGTGGTHAKVISVACTNNVAPVVSVLGWELTVEPNPDPIQGGEVFNAIVKGTAVASESFLTAARQIQPGLEELYLLDIKATVHVRSGATGDDVPLKIMPIPYKCAIGRTECDPEKDLPSIPGLRGNPDCNTDLNFDPCVRLVRLPISEDCSKGGECEAAGRTGPGSICSTDGFCITDDLRLEFEPASSGAYTADSGGEVLFGWADAATILDDETLLLPPADFDSPVGPIGLRVGVGVVGVALECAMGVEGPGETGRRTPDSALISFQIQPR